MKQWMSLCCVTGGNAVRHRPPRSPDSPRGTHLLQQPHCSITTDTQRRKIKSTPEHNLLHASPEKKPSPYSRVPSLTFGSASFSGSAVAPAASGTTLCLRNPRAAHCSACLHAVCLCKHTHTHTHLSLRGVCFFSFSVAPWTNWLVKETYSAGHVTPPGMQARASLCVLPNPVHFKGLEYSWS